MKKSDWLNDIKIVSTVNLAPGQDRFFIKQIKKPARYGYLLFDDLKNHKLIIHTLNNEQIEYGSVEEIEKDTWVIN